MVRRHFRLLAAYPLIALLIAQPALAASPGAASRKAVKVTQKPQASSVLRNVRNAAGVAPQDDGSNIQQVVGKQPKARQIDPDRSLSLLPKSLSGESGNAERRAPASRGLLGGLFGGSKKTTRQPTRTAATPAKTSQQTADWEGIPYHQARSKTTTSDSARTPIRDPGPGEARMAPTQTQPRLADLSPAPRNLPKPPALAPAPSSRRVASRPTNAPARVVSTRIKRDNTPALSSSSSSRRSGRSDLPRLDASEIAAAKAKAIPEDKLVPKVSRRRVKAEVVVVPEPKPEPKPKPVTTPAVDVPRGKGC